VNTGDNAATHDKEPFTPFGRVVSGMEHVDALNAEYCEVPGGIRAGKQDAFFEGGNARCYASSAARFHSARERTRAPAFALTRYGGAGAQFIFLPSAPTSSTVILIPSPTALDNGRAGRGRPLRHGSIEGPLADQRIRGLTENDPDGDGTRRHWRTTYMRSLNRPSIRIPHPIVVRRAQTPSAAR
jgi:hypothetical protein